MIDVNVKGTLYAVRAALPHLLESDAADIVTLASEAGRRGLPLEAVYCASKFAQVGFTRALDHELREQGIRCSNVCPGGVATDSPWARRTPDSGPAGMRRRKRGGWLSSSVAPEPSNLETAFRPSEPAWDERHGPGASVDGEHQRKLLAGAADPTSRRHRRRAATRTGRGLRARAHGVVRGVRELEELLADTRRGPVYISLQTRSRRVVVRAREAARHVPARSL